MEKDYLFSPFAISLLNSANDIAISLKHEFVMPEHFILAITEHNEISQHIKLLGFDSMAMAIDIRQYLNSYVESNDSYTTPTASHKLRKALASAHDIVNNDNAPIPSVAIVLALLESNDTYAIETFKKYTANKTHRVLEFMISLDNKAMSEQLGRDIDNDDDQPWQAASQPEWEKYVTNLTEKYGNGQHPIIGREEEMMRMAQILCRCDRNNALIIGEPGVGKTALVRGFISQLEEMAGRFTLLPSYEISTQQLMAGAQYQGEVEQRVASIMSGIKEQGGGIIVIDDIHTLFGSRGDANSSRDFSQLFMQHLDDEELRFIGITNHEDLTRHMDGNVRFLRRFQQIDLAEPTQEQAIEILDGIKKKYERHHNIKFLKGVTERAVKLSTRYLSGRALPDSAIDVLDEAGSYRELKPIENRKTQSVDTALIASIVARMGKVETSIMDDNDTSVLKNLRTKMSQNIFGQDTAITNVVESVLAARAGLTDEHKPQASLLFVGPTGVGKTEVARVLAKELGVTLHKFDMSEYSESYSVSKLIGSSPGYIGYEEGGRLTEAVRKSPHCVLLLDEIEKAHEKIYDTLLQVMDDASLTDSRGRKVDFRHVILIMTSNSGAQFAKQAGVGFGSTVTTGQAMLTEVKKTFKPEFINRLSGIVVFNDMSTDMASLILDKKLGELNSRLQERCVSITLTTDARNWVLARGFSNKYGARELERVISQYIKPLLVNEILFGSLKKGGKAIIDITNDQLALSTSK